MEKNGIEKSNLEKGGLNESEEKVDNTTNQSPPEISEKEDPSANEEVLSEEDSKIEQTEAEPISIQTEKSEEFPAAEKSNDSQPNQDTSEESHAVSDDIQNKTKDLEIKQPEEITEDKPVEPDAIESQKEVSEPVQEEPTVTDVESKSEQTEVETDSEQVPNSEESPESDKSAENQSNQEGSEENRKVAEDITGESKEQEIKKSEEITENTSDEPVVNQSQPAVSESREDAIEPEKEEKPNATEEALVEKPESSNGKKEDPKSDTDHHTDEREEHLEAHLDYSNYSKKQMVQVLESLLKEDDFSQVGRILKEIKKPYDILSSKERKAAFDKYVLDGGEKDGFEYRLDELDQRFHAAFGKLRERKNQYYNSLEKQKEQNLKIKQDILEKLRELVDSEETGTSIKAIKDLQVQWKEVGVIPSSQVKSLWANYNALLDRFYDQRSIYFELKELDRKKNYDLKIELCVKAEELVEQENIREVIKHLNELHEEFKHIGPVPNDVQEAVWERFKMASDKIYSRRKDYYEKLKGEFKLNEVAKEALIEKVTPFADFQSDRISDWNAKTKEVIAIQKEWEAIGSLPKEKAKSINKRFWTAFKSFFHKKGHFFKKIEDERKENLKLKQELVEKAEALKESDDFRKTSDELKKLQRQWKEIGPVPEKFRNEVYLNFKKSCDHFFDRRRANSGKIEKDYEENLKKKQSLCDELEKIVKNDSIDIERVKSIESEWAEIGFVPKSNIKKIQNRYSEVIRSITDKADIPDSEKHKMRFSAQFSNINYGPGAEKLIYKKESALRRQISTLENDISVWKNNMDFFASSKNADKLKEEFKVKIDKANDQLISLKEQLKVISNI